MLSFVMPSDSESKAKREDEGRAREKSSESKEKDPVQPSRERIGEGPDNLRRRGDWFQKRTGQSP
jgi:hypothetical protein